MFIEYFNLMANEPLVRLTIFAFFFINLEYYGVTSQKPEVPSKAFSSTIITTSVSLRENQRSFPSASAEGSECAKQNIDDAPVF